MHYALENFKHGKFMRYMWLLLATIVLGAGFLGGQAYEYTHLIYREHVTWAGSGVFGASFFTLTGMHGIHVSFGVCYLTVLVLQSAAGVYTSASTSASPPARCTGISSTSSGWCSSRYSISYESLG